MPNTAEHPMDDNDAEAGPIFVPTDESSDDFHATKVVNDGDAVLVSFEDKDTADDSLFHASWLWVNDPAHIHPTSGQRTRSPSSFYWNGGWKIDAAEVGMFQKVWENNNGSDWPLISPPPGCRHPTGSVYKVPGQGTDGSPESMLRITWKCHDGSRSQHSYYDLNWLRYSRYDHTVIKEQLAEASVTKESAIGSDRDLYQGDFQRLVSHNTRDEACLDLLDALVESGAALVHGAPSTLNELDAGFTALERAEEEKDGEVVAFVGTLIAGALSHGFLYGDTFHVRSVPDAHNIAYTSAPLPPHQDLSYYESQPGFQLLHCIENGTGIQGGESTLIDGMAAANEFQSLAPELFGILCTYEATFLKQREMADIEYRRPHIEVDAASRSTVVGFRWSPPFEGPLCIPPEHVKDFSIAYAGLERMLDNSLPHDPYISEIDPSLERQLRDYAIEHTWEQRLEPGQILIFNNQRLLHGRRGFRVTDTGSGTRHLAGCYTNMEETLSRYRVLRRGRLGDQGMFRGRKYQRNTGNGSSPVR